MLHPHDNSELGQSVTTDIDEFDPALHMLTDMRPPATAGSPISQRIFICPEAYTGFDAHAPITYGTNTRVVVPLTEHTLDVMYAAEQELGEGENTAFEVADVEAVGLANGLNEGDGAVYDN